MKKITALLLALCVFAGLVGCAFAETDYTGLWKVSMIAGSDGNPAPAADIPMTMEIAADGTAVLTLDGQGKECTWAVSENGITLTDAAGSAGEFPYVNNMLVYQIPGGAFYFARENDEPLSAEKFLGKWQNTSIEMGIYVIDPIASGRNFYVTLTEDSKAVFTIDGANEDGSWAIVAADTIVLIDASGAAKVLTYADDILTVEEEDILMIFTRMTETK